MSDELGRSELGTKSSLRNTILEMMAFKDRMLMSIASGENTFRTYNELQSFVKSWKDNSTKLESIIKRDKNLMFKLGAGAITRLRHISDIPTHALSNQAWQKNM